MLTVLSTIVFAMSIMPGVHAQQSNKSNEEGVWLRDPITGCSIWNFEPKGNEIISWSGTCKDNGKASR